MSVFKDKVLLITGGTGSFGNAVLRRFLTSDIKEIRIFSRDEKKQDDMRHHLQAQYPEQASKVKFYIGNVRNRESVDEMCIRDSFWAVRKSISTFARWLRNSVVKSFW